MHICCWVLEEVVYIYIHIYTGKYYSAINRMSLNKLWEIMKDREVWSATVQGLTKSWT